jgi:hypothetical protein
MSKNNGGALVKRVMDKERRLVEDIDKRERKGLNLENIDEAYGNYEINNDGTRVWSF